MKKKIVVLLSVVVVLSMLLCACGAEKSQITFSSGETLTAKEVKKLDNTNGYENDIVTVEMTVKKVNGDNIYSNDSMEIHCFWYSQGFDRTQVSEDLADTLNALRAGDRIRVVGRLDMIGTWQVTLDNVRSVEVIE